MSGRPTDEAHRASTPLELLFDLCFVVAVAQAGGRLHEELANGRTGHAIFAYLSVFFAIWWAWMNFTWFASAYDTDDVIYRLVTMVQIAGALILAAGIPDAFNGDFAVVTAGYVVMRIALVSQWLRAAHGDPARRRTTVAFAVGVTAVQIGWVTRLWLPHSFAWPSFIALAVLELVVPIAAERARRVTPYHRHHIAERYGLFTLIVLGESVLSATIAIQAALSTADHHGRLYLLAASGLVIVFAMWWIYFDRPAGDLLTSARSAFSWGYGHYLVFASAAAMGAGLAAAADGHLSQRAEGYAVAIPVAVFLLVVWALHIRPHRIGAVGLACPLGAALILLAPLTGVALPAIAGVLACVVAVIVVAVPAWEE
jgi:low temperature requirement protein LtrA